MASTASQPISLRFVIQPGTILQSFSTELKAVQRLAADTFSGLGVGGPTRSAVGNRVAGLVTERAVTGVAGLGERHDCCEKLLPVLGRMERSLIDIAHGLRGGSVAARAATGGGDGDVSGGLTFSVNPLASAITGLGSLIYIARQAGEAVSKFVVGPLKDVAAATAEAVEQSQRFENSISGIVGSLGKARQLNAELFRRGQDLPVSLSTLRESAQALSFNPGLSSRVSLAPNAKQAADEVVKFQSLISRLAVIDPAQGESGALTAVRELTESSGGGEAVASLRRRFGFNARSLARQVTGDFGGDFTQALEAIKSDPAIALKATTRLVESLVPDSAVQRGGRLLSVRVEKLSEGLRQALVKIGEPVIGGVVDHLRDFQGELFKYLDGGDFEDKARRLSSSLTRILDNIGHGVISLLEALSGQKGTGNNIASAVSLAEKAIARLASASDGLPAIGEKIGSFIGGLSEQIGRLVHAIENVSVTRLLVGPDRNLDAARQVAATQTLQRYGVKQPAIDAATNADLTGAKGLIADNFFGGTVAINRGLASHDKQTQLAVAVREAIGGLDEYQLSDVSRIEKALAKPLEATPFGVGGDSLLEQLRAVRGADAPKLRTAANLPVDVPESVADLIKAEFDGPNFAAQLQSVGSLLGAVKPSDQRDQLGTVVSSGRSLFTRTLAGEGTDAIRIADVLPAFKRQAEEADAKLSTAIRDGVAKLAEAPNAQLSVMVETLKATQAKVAERYQTAAQSVEDSLVETVTNFGQSLTQSVGDLPASTAAALRERVRDGVTTVAAEVSNILKAAGRDVDPRRFTTDSLPLPTRLTEQRDIARDHEAAIRDAGRLEGQSQTTISRRLAEYIGSDALPRQRELFEKAKSNLAAHPNDERAIASYGVASRDLAELNERLKVARLGANELEQAFVSFGASSREAFEHGLGDAIDGLISGTHTLSDAFRSMASSIIRSFSDIQARLISGALFGSLGQAQPNGLPGAEAGLIGGLLRGVGGLFTGGSTSAVQSIGSPGLPISDLVPTGAGGLFAAADGGVLPQVRRFANGGVTRLGARELRRLGIPAGTPIRDEAELRHGGVFSSPVAFTLLAEREDRRAEAVIPLKNNHVPLRIHGDTTFVELPNNRLLPTVAQPKVDEFANGGVINGVPPLAMGSIVANRRRRELERLVDDVDSLPVPSAARAEGHIPARHATVQTDAESTDSSTTSQTTSTRNFNSDETRSSSLNSIKNVVEAQRVERLQRVLGDVTGADAVAQSERTVRPRSISHIVEAVDATNLVPALASLRRIQIDQRKEAFEGERLDVSRRIHENQRRERVQRFVEETRTQTAAEEAINAVGGKTPQAATSNRLAPAETREVVPSAFKDAVDLQHRVGQKRVGFAASAIGREVSAPSSRQSILTVVESRRQETLLRQIEDAGADKAVDGTPNPTQHFDRRASNSVHGIVGERRLERLEHQLAAIPTPAQHQTAEAVVTVGTGETQAARPANVGTPVKHNVGNALPDIVPLVQSRRQATLDQFVPVVASRRRDELDRHADVVAQSFRSTPSEQAESVVTRKVHRDETVSSSLKNIENVVESRRQERLLSQLVDVLVESKPGVIGPSSVASSPLVGRVGTVAPSVTPGVIAPVAAAVSDGVIPPSNKSSVVDRRLQESLQKVQHERLGQLVDEIRPRPAVDTAHEAAGKSTSLPRSSDRLVQTNESPIASRRHERIERLVDAAEAIRTISSVPALQDRTSDASSFVVPGDVARLTADVATRTFDANVLDENTVSSKVVQSVIESRRHEQLLRQLDDVDSVRRFLPAVREQGDRSVRPTRTAASQQFAEAVEIAEAVKPLEEAAAKARRVSTLNVGEDSRSVNFPEREKGQSRDKIAGNDRPSIGRTLDATFDDAAGVLVDPSGTGQNAHQQTTAETIRRLSLPLDVERVADVASPRASVSVSVERRILDGLRREQTERLVDSIDNQTSNAVNVFKSQRLTVAEAVEISEAVKPLEEAAAKARQGERTDQHPGKFPESSKGDSRDKIAAAVVQQVNTTGDVGAARSGEVVASLRRPLPAFRDDSVVDGVSPRSTENVTIDRRVQENLLRDRIERLVDDLPSQDRATFSRVGFTSGGRIDQHLDSIAPLPSSTRRERVESLVSRKTNHERRLRQFDDVLSSNVHGGRQSVGPVPPAKSNAFDLRRQSRMQQLFGNLEPRPAHELSNGGLVSKPTLYAVGERRDGVGEAIIPLLGRGRSIPITMAGGRLAAQLPGGRSIPASLNGRVSAFGDGGVTGDYRHSPIPFDRVPVNASSSSSHAFERGGDVHLVVVSGVDEAAAKAAALSAQHPRDTIRLIDARFSDQAGRGMGAIGNVLKRRPGF